jgi:hypothetical protein
VPKWTEVAVTFAMVGAGFGIFMLAAKNLPVFESSHEKETEGERNGRLQDAIPAGASGD